MNGGPIIISGDTRASIQEAFHRGENTEMLSQRMVDFGLSKVAAIMLLRETTGMGLGAAKEAIHYSPAWAFRRASDEAFHERIYEMATRLGLMGSVDDEQEQQHEAPLLAKTGTDG